ncbi:MAG: DUF348 domain-containing protein [Chloroflexi bacterium]|nr:DUF348 domain-containing protein [Chloroflexota bacterium]
MDGRRQALSTEAKTVGEVLQEVGVTLGPFDRVQPKPWEEIGRGATIIVIRGSEKKYAEPRPLPFSRQKIQDEALPEGTTRLTQLGVNGTEVFTYSIRYEEGQEVGRKLVARKVITTPQPEIVVVGVRGALPKAPISGTLAYISNGNAWVIRDSTEQKRPLTFSGDLDGRVFALSPDGRWLLFTRRPLGGQAGRSGPLNTLWLVNTHLLGDSPRSLHASGVLYAQWSADGTRMAYSTAERTVGAPGWNARNDLWVAPLVTASLTDTLTMGQPRRVLPPHTDIPYAWWGTEWNWSPDGTQFAYAQADEIGMLDAQTGTKETLVRFAPYYTHASWVWVPHIAWSRDGQLLAAPLHLAPEAVPGGRNPPQLEESTRFGLSILRPARGVQVIVADQVGMWAWPSWSPDDVLAYGIARQPSSSDRSVYDLYLMDADGSNRRRLFPPDGAPGLDIPQVAWSPAGNALSLEWQNDIYVVNVATGKSTRITANGHSSHARWAR